MCALRCLLLMAFVAFSSAALAADSLMVATTTSTQDTGLLDYLQPLLLKETGIDVKWVSTGSGKALEHGKNCDVDVLLVHAPDAELKMVEAGLTVDRRPVMYAVVDRAMADQRVQYSVMTVNPARCPRVKAGLAKKFTEWWVSASTRKHIAAFTLEGRQLFFPDAAPPSR